MSGADQFVTRISELQRRVGRGTLRGSLVRDQPYAQKISEDLTLRHPGGGGPKYQEGPLYANYPRYLRMVADTVLDPEGPARGMADAMEAFDRDSAAVTPKESTALSRSGHPTVSSDGRTVYDRAPEVPRQERDAPGRRPNPAADRARRPR